MFETNVVVYLIQEQSNRVFERQKAKSPPIIPSINEAANREMLRSPNRDI